MKTIDRIRLNQLRNKMQVAQLRLSKALEEWRLDSYQLEKRHHTLKQIGITNGR